MQAIVKFFGQLLYKLCYFIGKYVCKAIGAVCKFAWKMGKTLYQNYKEKKAANAATQGSSATATASADSSDAAKVGDGLSETGSVNSGVEKQGQTGEENMKMNSEVKDV